MIDGAVARYSEGDRTFSELAEETGLAVEEIMRAMGDDGRDEALAGDATLWSAAWGALCRYA